jgi:hypothetical protein
MTVQTSSADGFPFVGPIPDLDGHYIAAGFAGHGKWLASQHPYKKRLIHVGMPRILLTAAHLAPLILDSLGVTYSQPSLASTFPPLPRPFEATRERIERLRDTDVKAIAEQYKQGCEKSAQKPYCNLSTAGVSILNQSDVAQSPAFTYAQYDGSVNVMKDGISTVSISSQLL